MSGVESFVIFSFLSPFFFFFLDFSVAGFSAFVDFGDNSFEGLGDTSFVSGDDDFGDIDFLSDFFFDFFSSVADFETDSSGDGFDDIFVVSGGEDFVSTAGFDFFFDFFPDFFGASFSMSAELLSMTSFGDKSDVFGDNGAVSGDKVSLFFFLKYLVSLH